MIEQSLQRQLEPAAWSNRRWRLWRALALGWLGAGLFGIGLLLVHRWTGWGSSSLAIGLGLIGGLIAIIAWRRYLKDQPDWHALAQQIEQKNPELQALLLTAVEQKPEARTGQFSFLQDRLILAAFRAGYDHPWTDPIPAPRFRVLQFAHWAALAFLVVVLAQLHTLESTPATRVFARGVTVTPGDTNVERGSGLVVLARFTGRLPNEVSLVIRPSAGGSQTVPLAKNLDDPVFGGSLMDIQSNLTYHLEYAGQRTRDYSVQVFEHPRLERLDVEIQYPPYTGLPEKRLENTRRVTAVEGSRLELAFQFNKPVASAQLVGKDKSVVPLAADPRVPAASLTNFLLTTSQAYELQLVDAEGRTNKIPTQVIVSVLTNRLPELKLAAPLGDQRVSALEELNFRGEVTDDFGLRAYGLAYTVAGEETKTITLGQSSGINEKRQFQHLLPLEDLHVSPYQLISYYLWADDTGPDGQARRATGDLFFAEVRPFDEIFRPSQNSSPEANQSEESSESGDRESGSATQLAELQKQIIIATWRLQNLEKKDPPSSQYLKDAPVVRQSQEQALNQARQAKSRALDPKTQAGFETVENSMNQALEHLTKATNSPGPLPEALVDEQAAYQALLKLQANEYQVAQGRSNRRGNRSGGRSQQQLQQLQMAASENRYETERQAARPNTPQRAEEQQIQNRLKELAQRQQDVNERLKELQTALREARTEAEREAARRRLKRLREEEQQMLADLDELQQRMNQPQNQSRLADARNRLEQSRSEVQRAADAMQNESVPEALTSGVRAERELDQLRQDFRQRNAGQLADDLRQLRSDARALAQQQEAVGNQMRELTDPRQKSLSQSEPRAALAEQLKRQKNSLTNLLDRATEITQEAEVAEPLAAKKLYDTLRQSQQDKIDNLLELTSEMVRRSFVPQASQLEERVRQGINNLKNGVEQAAESVLGDEAEALRLARREIDELAQQLDRERARYQSNIIANLVADDMSATNRGPGEAGLQSLFSRGSSNTNAAGQNRGQPNRLSSNSDRPADNASPQPGQEGSRSNPLAQNQRDGRNRNQPAPTPGRNRTNQEGGTETLTSGTGPITGPDYLQWSERLRDVADMLDYPDWRNEVSRIRDRAQALRVEFKRHGTPPQWALVENQVLAPLVQVRNLIQEELARKENKEGLIPLDRDPVPAKYSELVRRYYERLGRDN